MARITAFCQRGLRRALKSSATVSGGSALAKLALQVALLGDQQGGLQVWQTVIIGSLCDLPWFTPDEVVTGWMDGFGTVSINVQAVNPASETG